MEQLIDTLADMALFVEVARTSSFRHASARLSMPVSTLSRRIAALERRLGVQLLVRTTRSVKLAPSAATYFDRCVQVLDAATHAQDALEVSRRRLTRLRISMPVDLGVEMLGPVIAAYAVRQPGLAIDFDLSSLAKDLFKDPVDLVFRIGRPLDDRVVARKVIEVPGGLFASPSYLRHHGTPASPEDLNQARCLSLQMAQGPLPWSVGNASWPGTPGQVTLSANSVALLRSLAAQGHGVALLPLHLAQPYTRQRALVQVLPDEAVRGWTLFALTASRAAPVQVKGLIAYVREQLASRPLAGSGI